MRIQVGRSKSGKPTVTENGGGSSNTGSAQIVCAGNGDRIKPMFVPRGYSNGEHAIFVAKRGMCLVQASFSRQGEQVEVYRIKGIIKGTDDADLELVGKYENGDGNILPEFDKAVKAALGKAHSYHCRNAHYILV